MQSYLVCRCCLSAMLQMWAPSQNQRNFGLNHFLCRLIDKVQREATWQWFLCMKSVARSSCLHFLTANGKGTMVALISTFNMENWNWMQSIACLFFIFQAQNNKKTSKKNKSWKNGYDCFLHFCCISSPEWFHFPKNFKSLCARKPGNPEKLFDQFLIF